MLLNVFKPQDVREYYSVRTGETKIGEEIKTLPNGVFCAKSLNEARQAGARFALFGIPEDIGPRANCGRGGAADGWKAFLKYFLNQQSNCFLSGRDILLVGSIDCQDLQEASFKVPEREEKLTYLRALCARLDERVFPIAAALTAYGYIPVVIGGGHNNAYPLIKGTALGLSLATLPVNVLEDHPLIKLAFGNSEFCLGESLANRPLQENGTAVSRLASALDDLAAGSSEGISISDSICDEEISLAEAVRRHLQLNGSSANEQAPSGPVDDCGWQFAPISVVNCDPHGDFRALEGRHSGNPFSYAKLGRYLENYCLVNYQESFNSANMLAYMRAQGVRAFSYESVYIRREFSFSDTLDFVIRLMLSSGRPAGIELDADAVAGMPSSASSPCGITLEDAGYYLHSMASSLPVVYAHFPEAAPSLAPDGERIAGKGLAMLVSTFIKALTMPQMSQPSSAGTV